MLPRWPPQHRLRGHANGGGPLGSGSSFRADVQTCPQNNAFIKNARILQHLWAAALTVQRLDGTVLLLPVRLQQSPVEDAAKVTCGRRDGASVGTFASNRCHSLK